MKIETISDKGTALELGMKKKHLLLNTYDELTVCAAENPPIEQEILEARFFDESGEVKIFRDGSELRAVSISDNGSERVLDEAYRLLDGGVIVLRRYLDFDEDGQVYFSCTRLYDYRQVK